MTKKKLKVLYVNHIGNVMGGAEHSLSILLKNLDKENFHPILLLPEHGPVFEYFTSFGVETHVVPINYIWLPTPRQYYKLFKDLRTRLNWFDGKINIEGVDIIHTNDEEAFDAPFAAKIYRVPHIWHIRHRFIENNQSFLNYFSSDRFSMGELINELSDRVLTVSEEVKESLQPYVESKKINVVYNAIEPEKYEISVHKNDIRRELGISPETLLVCSAGRICREKGFDVYVDAAALILKHFKDVRFLIIGRETEKGLVEKLEKQIKKLQIEKYVYFLGYRHDLSEILRQIDIFTLASVEGEGLGRVAVEAQCSQKPVVVSQYCGAREAVLDSETGYVVPVNRADLIAEKIIYLLKNYQMRSEMGLKGEKMVRERFSVSVHVRNIENIYYELAGTKQNDTKTSILPGIIADILGEYGDVGLRLVTRKNRANGAGWLLEKIKIIKPQ